MLKYFVFAFVAFLLTQNIASGQINAVTENGEEVILFDNGTWKYTNINPAYDTRLDTPVVVKSKDATFLVKSKVTKTGVYINPKKWSFKAEESGGPVEYMFNMKNGGAYAMLITEKIELSLQLLQTLALENARKVAPDAHFTSEETRVVNGNVVKVLGISGTLRGVGFSYLGYYYVGEIGTIQLVGYTSDNLFKEYKSEIEELLNGLTLID